jgi:hypothetical protein
MEDRFVLILNIDAVFAADKPPLPHADEEPHVLPSSTAREVPAS